MIILCPYCIEPAKLVTGREIYVGKIRDRRVMDRPFWACLSCQAWVGCHPGTEKPLGRLADKKLRLAKMAAHSAFDPIWKHRVIRPDLRQQSNRAPAYKWLAEMLGIKIEDCHIGMMDLATCRRVVEACQALRRTRTAA